MASARHAEQSVEPVEQPIGRSRLVGETLTLGTPNGALCTGRVESAKDLAGAGPQIELVQAVLTGWLKSTVASRQLEGLPENRFGAPFHRTPLGCPHLTGEKREYRGQLVRLVHKRVTMIGERQRHQAPSPT